MNQTENNDAAISGLLSDVDTWRKDPLFAGATEEEEKQIAAKGLAEYEAREVNTPAQKILWAGMELYENLKHEALDSLDKDSEILDGVVIELVEGYSIINPGIAIELIDAIQSNSAKVEAMAKFGANTGDDLMIKNARELASDDIQNLLIVGRFGRDAKSLALAAKNVEKTDGHQTPNWASEYIVIASSGYRTALDMAKRHLIRYQAVDWGGEDMPKKDLKIAKGGMINIEQHMADIIRMEAAFDQGEVMDMYLSEDPNQMSLEERSQIHESWRKLIYYHRKEVLNHLQRNDMTPFVDSFKIRFLRETGIDGEHVFRETPRGVRRPYYEKDLDQRHSSELLRYSEAIQAGGIDFIHEETEDLLSMPSHGLPRSLVGFAESIKISALAAYEKQDPETPYSSPLEPAHTS